MPVEKWSDNVALARLADNPHVGDDLDALDAAIQQRRLDAVVDFSGVKMINSTSLAKLIKIRRHMNAAESRLLLCGVNDNVWGAFLVTNLDKLFDFMDDVPTALAALQIKTGHRQG
jgi:anti-anti-sigma factor